MSDTRGPGAGEDDALHRWMVQASPDGLWVFDDAGRTVFANDRMAQLLALDPADIAGFSVFDALDSVGKEQFRAHLDDLRSRGEPGDNLECSFIDAKGDRLWVLVSHTPLLDDAGRRRGWMHRVSEYSEQRRLLDQLADAQAIARIGSWEWEVAADRVWWSDELYRIYGIAPGELEATYEGFLARIHPDDRGRVGDVVGSAVTASDSFEFDARVVRPTGEMRWIRGRGRVLRDPDGRALRMGGTTQDVTEAKSAEQALELLTAMATAANESSTLADALPIAMRHVEVHTAWRPVLGALVTADDDLVPCDECTVEQVPDAAVELARSVVGAGTQQTTRGDEGTVLVAVPVRAESRVRCVLVLDTRSTSPLAAADARTMGQVAALFARVAERELDAERLAQARDEAMEASRAKSDFLATMSHEIRTPLNGVIGLSELLHRTELTPHQRRLSEGIDQAGRVLLGLVNDILDLSKIEAGRLDLEEIDFEPAAVVERGAGLVRERARTKGLALDVVCDPDVPVVLSGDPVRFGQVVANLTSNAVKFTASGGITVHTSVESSDDDGCVLRIEVSDTGVGMSPRVQGRLFEAFSQGDSSTTREYGGTGLGLAISKQIVEAMGGEIGVRSRTGVGSTFWFTARFSQARELGTGADVPRSSSLQGVRALLVDDKEANRSNLEQQLGAWHVITVTASSGVEALVHLDEAHRAGEPFDVVVLQYLMPGVNGEQLARMVRADGRFSRTGILLLTSAVPPSQPVLDDAGIDQCLTQPVLPSELLDSLVSLVADRLVDPAPRGDEAAAASGDDPLGLVLVVEDNPVNQLVAQGVLESFGYRVVLADNGVEGVRVYREEAERLSAVLMDCQMPQMDGYEATRRIRALGGRRVPVIAMTASAIAGERERCLEAGMDDFLTKPIDVALLGTTLERWVSGDVGGRASDRGQPEQAAGGGPDDAGAVLDRSRLEVLLDLDPEDPSMVLRFIERFRSSAQARIGEMRAAHAAGDAIALGRAAHGLKGSAANLGCDALADVCRSVERLGDEGRLAPTGLVAEVEEHVVLAAAALDSVAVGLRTG